MKEKSLRVWEIDFFRGIAIILMVVFHIVFDLSDLYNFPIPYEHGEFYFVGKAAAILFMLIAGISCFFSRNNVKRGIRVFAAAMAITLVTYIFMPDLTIKFGILHFLGICMILYPLLKRLNRYYLLAGGVLAIAAGIYMSRIIMPFNFLFPIGLTGNNFTSGDYYPLLPWIGVFMFGIAAGKIFYPQKKSLFKFQAVENPVSFMGRHSLLIYVIHQPIILLVLKMLVR